MDKCARCGNQVPRGANCFSNCGQDLEKKVLVTADDFENMSSEFKDILSDSIGERIFEEKPRKTIDKILKEELDKETLEKLRSK